MDTGKITYEILRFVTKEISSELAINELVSSALLSIILILCIASIGFAIIPALKNIFYSDYNKYNDLIYDLEQLKIFNQ